jgi:hypothetical protein
LFLVLNSLVGEADHCDAVDDDDVEDAANDDCGSEARTAPSTSSVARIRMVCPELVRSILRKKKDSLLNSLRGPVPAPFFAVAAVRVFEMRATRHHGAEVLDPRGGDAFENREKIIHETSIRDSRNTTLLTDVTKTREGTVHHGQALLTQGHSCSSL